jgi:hypothetical protein
MGGVDTDPVRVHMILAITLAVLLVSWGVLLSPPFRGLRASIGLPTDLPGARFNPEVNAAEIISKDEEGAKFFLARVAHYYHALFAVLLYGMLAAFGSMRKDVVGVDLLNITLIGTIFTVTGAIVYSYISRTFFWHGLFISGLAILFSSGLLTLLRFKPSKMLDLALIVALILLLGGGAIGAYVGSSYINSEVAEGFERAKILARFNPDLGEDNEIWRAMTGHLHTMVALATTMTFLIGIYRIGILDGKLANLNGKLAKISILLVIFGELVMALASYSVWFFGKIAHLIITPAALILIASTLILSFLMHGYGLKESFKEPKGLLFWGLRLGNIWTWAFIALPGAIVAISLRKPIFFNPEFRNELWDWAELSYNIGHWHIIVVLWGVMLLLIYLADVRSKLASAFGWLSLIGMLGATAAANLYMLANPPGPYSPNPYSNFWLSTIVEPFLILMSIGIAVSYLLFLIYSTK